MDQRIQHAFVNKPIYKRFRKCVECKKRIIWTQIAKCKGCKTYCHRRCMPLNNDECCRPNSVESTAQITDPDLETVVTQSNEEDRDLKMVLLTKDDDIGDLSPAAESEVVADRPENSANASCAEISEIAERRLYVPDDGNIGAGTGSQDEYCEAIKDVTATPSEDVITTDECGTVPADEELRAAEHMPTPSDDVTTAEECSAALLNVEVHANPTQDGDAFNVAPYRLPCVETETDETRQDDDNGFERNKCGGDECVQKAVAEENKLDQPL